MFLSIPFLFLILFRRRKNDLSHDAEFLRPENKHPECEKDHRHTEKWIQPHHKERRCREKAVSAYMTSTTCFCDRPAARRRWWR